MKIKLPFLGIFMFVYSCLQGQEDKKELINNVPLYNFFYLSKSLDNQYLKTEQKNAVNAQFINLIGTEKLKMLQNYTGSDFDHLKNYLKILNISSPARLEFKYDLKKGDYEAFKNKYTINSKFKITLDSIITEKNEIDSLVGKKAKLLQDFNFENKKQTFSYSLETTDQEKNVLQDTLKIKKDNLEKDIKTLDNNIKDKSQSLEDKIEKFSKAYAKDNSDFGRQTDNLNYLSAYYTEEKVDQSVQITNNYVQSLQNQGTSSFKIPSEAQLIDAMALFLAKRAKQEAAIWFMDQLRRQLTNPLISASFPESIKLISSLEDYKVPNFGVEWRYAISKDFVKMPENIVHSKWIELKINNPKKVKEIKTTVEFGSKLSLLMAENYNYRDIIKSLYLDELKKTNIPDNAAILENFLNKNITLLYTLTNELYSIDNTSKKPAYRLLTFEELNSLNNDQWEYLVELIHLKYFYNNPAIPESQFKKQFDNLKLCKEETQIFISSILLNLSQFDKIRKEVASTNSGEKEDFIKQNYNTPWKIVIQILDNLSNTNFLNSYSYSQENIKKYVGHLKSSIAIYENIQSRNYRAAVQNTMELINTLPLQISTNTSDYNTMPYQILNNIYTAKKDGKILLLQKENNYIKIQTRKDYINKFNDDKPSFKLFYTDENINDLWAIVKGIKTEAKKFEEKYSLNTREYKKILKNYEISTDEVLNLADAVFADKKKENYKTMENPIFQNANIDFSVLNKKYGTQLLKLTSFFGDVLTATTSDQLADVIGSHALPPTSYKLKRKVRSSIDLNAFVGGYGGYRFPSASSTLNENFTGGLTAPIGITFSSSFGQNKNCNVGFSLNFIDLGNIVNHYLTSTEQYYKDVHFSEVFSPNINFFYSIPRTPAVFFIGTTFLPLKTITVGTEIKNNVAFDVIIIQAGLAIDIPLINLWTNEKN